LSDPGHATFRYYEMFFPDHLTRCETLAVLREPVARFLSAFDFLMSGGGKDVRIQERPLRKMRHIRSIDQLLDFLEAAQGDWLRVDTFVRPQSWYITDINGAVAVHHLWLLAGDGQGFARFLADRGYPPLPHINRTMREERALTPSQLARVQRLYADDFALYAALKNQGGYACGVAGASVRLPTRAETIFSMAS
jgi:hypothetical protein